ncbi:MAG: DsbA family protein [Parvularculaceae bacterium]
MRLTVLRAALLAAPFLLAACGQASSNGASDKPADATETSGPEAAALKPTDMVLGDAAAPVTLIEYASVTCPHCATFHETMLPNIKEKYIDTGKVKLVFREYPTPPAEFSLIGSLMARCAAEKADASSYFLIIASLMKDQRNWIYGEDPKAELLKIAAQTGMDEAAFDTCLQRQELVDLINSNTKEAIEKFNIQGTPAFILDGEKLPLRTEEDFTKALDDAIAAAGN